MKYSDSLHPKQVAIYLLGAAVLFLPLLLSIFGYESEFIVRLATFPGVLIYPLALGLTAILIESAIVKLFSNGLDNLSDADRVKNRRTIVIMVVIDCGLIVGLVTLLYF